MSNPDVSNSDFLKEAEAIFELISSQGDKSFFDLAKTVGLNILTDFAGGDLREVDLSRADLRGIDLKYANLQDANLSHSDLQNADLSNADLRGVNLTGTNLNSAIVENALFTNNVGLSEETMISLQERGAIIEISEKPLSQTLTMPQEPRLTEVESLQTDGSIEFERYEPKQLEKYCLIPQSLDNQWVSRTLLYRMFQQGLRLRDVQQELDQAKRMEFKRALITAPQLVINRAYLYNERVVSENYSKRGSEREAFKTLLSEGTIVPFLAYEDSPIQPPSFTTADFEAWKQVCQEVQMKCVRLSWDQEENKEFIQFELMREFHDFATNLASGDARRYLRDLGLPEEAENAFQQKLNQINKQCTDVQQQGKKITREMLYREFVIRDGTDPVEGIYDAAKPFAAEIKQLIDLKYNINLPECLDKIALTPFDSLPRTALQENITRRKTDKTADDWIRMLRNSAFERLQSGLFLESLLQDGYLDSFASLTLQEVLDVRRTDEWQNYIQQLNGLLDDPEQFEQGAEAVYESYIQLNGLITNLVGQTRKEDTATWTPGIEYSLECAGARMSVTWAANEPPTYAFSGEVSARFARRSSVPYVEKFKIAGTEENQIDLNMAIEIKKGYMEYPGEQWKALKSQVKTIGFKEDKMLTTNNATIGIPN